MLGLHGTCQRRFRLPVAALGGLALLLIAWNGKLSAQPADSPSTLPADSQAAQVREFSEQVLPFLAKHCLRCHDEKDEAGAGLNFQDLRDPQTLGSRRDDWEHVSRKIHSGEMPPREVKERPAKDEIASVTARLEREFERLDRLAPRDPGPALPRRLNRTEYEASVRDLLGVNLAIGDDFPPDDTGYGFDNNGHVLTMSPLLMDRYLQAAEKVARAAVFGPEREESRRVKYQPWFIDFSTSSAVPTSYDETGMSLPSALHVRHRVPIDGDYTLWALLRGNRPEGSNPIELGFWVDGKLVKEGRATVPPGGEVSGQYAGIRIPLTAGEHWLSITILRQYEGLPEAYRGPRPATPEPAAANPPSPPPATPPAAKDPAAQPEVAPSNVENPAAADPAANPEVVPPAGNRGRGRGARGGRGGRLAASDGFFVSNLDVVGPLEQRQQPTAESLAKVFVCGAGPEGRTDACAPVILKNLAQRAWRRPLTEQEAADLLALFHQVRKDGESFEEALCWGIQKILVSPHFLYRIERFPPGTEVPASTGHVAAVRVSAHELATRLSYFLWSSLPDEELLRAADNRSLLDREQLAAQVTRMLRDPKASRLAENFGGQWLQFRGLESHEPERKRFQEFTDYTRDSMAEETRLYCDHIFREDRSILEFLHSDYTFLNQRLAEFYGIPGVVGHEWRKVRLPEDSMRGGVLTQASVLTVSSYATRTSPVLRGKWVLENLLNAPPPDPPANVPPLDDKNVGTATSLRAQLEQHRAQATCASCHSRMDPLGFGLENFNAIGQWREKEGTIEIDASGELPSGETFRGPQQLKALLSSQQTDFVNCLTEKMLIYALGRGLQPSDRQVVREITNKVVSEDYRSSALVLAIVESYPFQYRRFEGISP